MALKRDVATVLHWDKSADFEELESVYYNITAKTLRE